ncbi:mannose-1-phosphate guanyltransferase alpha [Eurytemora carolleeae]|uniref:mannose-1-phosphate guanyltransferase alpha n=1 Tax=Eurytemora carolleeae TaxID=1294199 RepID=UPI000C761AF7|nr:mannose-1-phosphate guanyltransferase alpha [Eurytemora carolleeae]|eukprot:XP_023328485.1 mannose-1-phosphate guanyltransferase alpha-like [Eurytemora affinis]
MQKFSRVEQNKMAVVKAVILIAGPQKGTRFRPLSLDVPKPLFPVAGIPILQHHIEACASVPEIKEILVLGFYPAHELSTFIQEMSEIHSSTSIRYLQEYSPLGTAGGIYHFRDQIRAGNPDAFFVMNGDVCADFPLKPMLEFHQGKVDCIATMMGTEATRQQSVNFGCIVEDKNTHSILHYVEKPETYVSTLINCGVYIFSQQIFQMLQTIFQAKQTEFYSGLDGKKDAVFEKDGRDAIWLEKDVMVPLAGTNTSYVYLTNNWWSQVKTAGSAIYANRHYLNLYRNNYVGRLAQDRKKGPTIIGDVFIHSTAKVDPSAVIGWSNNEGDWSKVLLLTLPLVLGWSSIVGDWSRVEGTPDDPNPNKPFAKIENNPLFNSAGQMNPSITILGGHVIVPSEVIILNSIVLPHKELSGSYKNQIIL